ncbi:MAG: hypothetical protein JSS66_07955 [Armatimonadetes bacterium]|nr:hypothetical protein [Armatimonadota bacterium]
MPHIKDGLQYFSRAEAIQIVKAIGQDSELFGEPEETEDYCAMTNEELEAELCLSGYIHDTDFGGVHD